MSRKLICPICGNEMEIKCGNYGNNSVSFWRTFYLKCNSCGINSRHEDITVKIDDSGEVIVYRSGFDELLNEFTKVVCVDYE